MRLSLRRVLAFAAAFAVVVTAPIQPNAKPLIEQDVVTTLAADSVFIPEANTPVAASAQSAASVHAVTLVLAKWSGLAVSEDSASLKSELTSLINNQVSDYWNTATNGRVSFTVTDAHGYITTNNKACDSGIQDAGAFWNEVASKVGFTDGAGKHLVVWFPSANCGGTSGLGTVGSAGLAGGGWVWINGSKNRSIFAHELGHNFGLGHANTLNCSESGVRVADSAPSNCSSKSYADLTDVMGISHSNAGALNPRNLHNLGILSSPDVIDITQSQRVSLKPLSSAPSSAPRVARLTINGDIYYVVVRAQVGLDSWLSPTLGSGDPGVAIYRAPSGWDNRASYLVDADPQTADATYSTTKTILDSGQSVKIQGGAFTITATSVSSSGAVITFSKNGEEPVVSDPAPTPTPTVTITPTPISTTPPATGPTVVINQTALYAGALARYGSTWTAPLYVTWSTGETAIAQYLDNKSVLTSVRHASTRLNLASNTTAQDVATIQVTSANSSGSASARLMGLIRTDDPQTGKVTYRGTWKKTADSYAHNRYVRRGVTSGSKITVTTTGRSLAVVASKGKNHAVVDIYVNGIRKATVNTELASTKRGQIIWRANYSSEATRTITIVHRGSGYFDFDGVVELY